MGIYANSILISLSIAILAFIALWIFTQFGKKVLGKMEVQSLLFTKFIEHAKKDSEDIRQIVFKQQGQIDKSNRKLDDFSRIVTDLHNRHVDQDH